MVGAYQQSAVGQTFEPWTIQETGLDSAIGELYHAEAVAHICSEERNKADPGKQWFFSCFQFFVFSSFVLVYRPA